MFQLPPTDQPWRVYKKAVGPVPTITIHQKDPDPRPKVVFVLGGPGAGKGTMCELAATQLGWTHISAGDLLRAERNKGGERSDLINGIIKEGKLVPSEITTALLHEEMKRVTAESGVENFLIDGFPRNQGNLDAWESVVGDAAKVALMLFFECPLPELEKRILGRAKFSGRKDDNIESLRKRFNTYKTETMPVVDVFRERKLVAEIDSSPARPEVWARVKALLSPWSDAKLAAQPLSNHSECLLGLRKWPKKKKKNFRVNPNYYVAALGLSVLAFRHWRNGN